MMVVVPDKTSFRSLLRHIIFTYFIIHCSTKNEDRQVEGSPKIGPTLKH